MHPLQWQLKTHWLASLDDPVTPVFFTEECSCIRWWLQEERWNLGLPFQIPPSYLLFMDTLQMGWVAHLQDPTVAGT